MTRRHQLYLLCACTIAVSAIGAWLTIAAKHASAIRDIEHWQAAYTAARSIQTRLDHLPVSRSGAPQSDHVASLARRMLITAGIGQEALAGIQPLEDGELPGGTWHRQQILLQLRRLTTQQAAAVVDAVGRTDPSWSVASIQLTHVGDADTYDASLALTTLYPVHP